MRRIAGTVRPKSTGLALIDIGHASNGTDLAQPKQRTGPILVNSQSHWQKSAAQLAPQTHRCRCYRHRWQTQCGESVGEHRRVQAIVRRAKGGGGQCRGRSVRQHGRRSWIKGQIDAAHVRTAAGVGHQHRALPLRAFQNDVQIVRESVRQAGQLHARSGDRRRDAANRGNRRIQRRRCVVVDDDRIGVAGDDQLGRRDNACCRSCAG